MNITLKQAEGYIAQLKPFISGNLTAQWEGSGEPGSFAEPVYRVRSYGTVIAWATRATYGLNAWLMPEAWDYSVTTSKHANTIRRVWDTARVAKRI